MSNNELKDAGVVVLVIEETRNAAFIDSGSDAEVARIIETARQENSQFIQYRRC